MSRIAYVNGRYVRHMDAEIHIEDRGYQFADGVYEVCAFRQGRLLDEALHLERLQYSLGELRIALPMSIEALRHVIREVIRRNRLADGIVYLQITRGIAPRDHPFPTKPTAPSLVVTAKRTNLALLQKQVEQGVAIITMPDERWARPDIKSISLLPNVLAKQAAKEAGAYEAWLVDRDGYVTEGSSTNAWIVSPEGLLITRPANRDILNGITRRVLIETAQKKKLKLIERPFSVKEAEEAAEAFLSASTAIIIPVVKINGFQIGNGSAGSVTRALREAYGI